MQPNQSQLSELDPADPQEIRKIALMAAATVMTHQARAIGVSATQRRTLDLAAHFAHYIRTGEI